MPSPAASACCAPSIPGASLARSPTLDAGNSYIDFASLAVSYIYQSRLAELYYFFRVKKILKIRTPLICNLKLWLLKSTAASPTRGEGHSGAAGRHDWPAPGAKFFRIRVIACHLSEWSVANWGGACQRSRRLGRDRVYFL